jgi:hypothetical protein
MTGMFKEIAFDSRLLWFGAAMGVLTFVLNALDGHVFLGLLTGAAVGVLAQIALTVVLTPIAYYQMWRIQYALPLWQIACLYAVGLALVVAYFFAVSSLERFTVGRLLIALLFPVGLIAAYIEWQARKKRTVLDVSKSRELQLK